MSMQSPKELSCGQSTVEGSSCDSDADEEPFAQESIPVLLEVQKILHNTHYFSRSFQLFI